ncbi:MAG: hypothetical protein AB1801_17585 [Chloroflexota bacterium]
MKRLLLTTLVALIYSLIFAGLVLAQEPGGSNGGGSPDVWAVLTPILAAATAVERIIEMIFDWYESLILNASRLIGEGKGYVGWAQKQVRRYQVELLKPSTQNDANTLSWAETQLALAQERLQDYLKSPFYTSRKRALTLILGTFFGLVVAFILQLRMFHLLLNLELPSILNYLDIFVTGLIIGTGSVPVHSLIGLLQNTKDAVYEGRTLWKAQAQRAVVEQVLEQLKNLQPERGGGFSAQAAEKPGLSDIELRRYVQHMLR